MVLGKYRFGPEVAFVSKAAVSTGGRPPNVRVSELGRDFCELV